MRRSCRGSLAAGLSAWAVFNEPASQGDETEREWTLVRKDGSRLNASLVITAMRTRTGK